MRYSFDDFVEIIRILRSPDGCPWDREQTHKTIRNEFIEETYEAVDAIDRSDSTDLCEELGDVLLQIMLHSQISAEAGEFDINDVIDGVAKKMVLRHPHVFGDVNVENTEQVLDNWDKIKRVEKSQGSFTDTLKSVPMSYPALMRAAKIQKRAKKAGFDWEELEPVMAKLDEETAELKQAVQSSDASQIFEEYGDLLFTMVNISRFLKIDSEEALQKANDKFISRFAAVEKMADENGIDMKSASLETLDTFWEQTKR